MPFCLDCNCYFDFPGTCNCFAPGGKRAIQLTTVASAPIIVANVPTCPICHQPYRVPEGSSIAPCRGHNNTTISCQPSTSN